MVDSTWGVSVPREAFVLESLVWRGTRGKRPGRILGECGFLRRRPS